VPSSDSGKELGTISCKNPGERPGKKSGKELPGQVKLGLRRPDMTKMCKTRRFLCFG
jgi:hypothetical protein